MYQCTMLSQTVLMVALADYHQFWVEFQTSDSFVIQSGIGGEQKFDWGFHQVHNRQHARLIFLIIGSEGWISIFLACPGTDVYYVRNARDTMCRELTSTVEIVRRELLVQDIFTLEMTANHYWNMLSTNIPCSLGLSTGWMQVVEFAGINSRYINMTLTLKNVIT